MTDAKMNILLVDDDPAMLRILSKWMANAEFSVRIADSIEQAKKMIQLECPDVVLVDAEMPENGLNLVTWLRKQTLPHYVYAVISTTRCGKQDIVAAFTVGADDFLKKPLDKDEIMARLLSARRVIQLEHNLQALSRNDPLTGLMHRTAFVAQLEMEWARASRFPIPMSNVFIDLDHFRKIDSHYGHAVGDAVLCQLAEMIRQFTRSSDAACRFNGDTLSVLLTETNEQGAFLWAERMRQHLEATPYLLPTGESIPLTASFGVAQRCENTLNARQLIDFSQQAVKMAKQTGKNRVIAHGSLYGEQTLSSSVKEVFAPLVALQIMSAAVPELHTTDTIEHALRFFLRFHLHEAPVVNRENIFQGWVTEQDLMSATLEPNWREDTIARYLHTNGITFEENTAALDVYNHFCQCDQRSVVVVRENQPVGIIYRHTLLLWLTQSQWQLSMNPLELIGTSVSDTTTVLQAV
jgi:two-component system, cell cycle response regulator